MIKGFHAHVYYDQNNIEEAQKICEGARDKFEIPMGRMHEKNVGPHPRWSCQLSISCENFGEVIPWLALNRKGLTLFIHPETGDDLKDHTDFAIWMGELLELNLSIFQA